MTGGIINTYCRTECWLCGQIISYNGLSQGSHYNMHVREGYMFLTSWNPNSYKRTSKLFNKKEYQNDRPHKAYSLDDYFPIYDNPRDRQVRSIILIFFFIK